jgi:diguanylate cyclase (GGDEF)-like protein
MGTREPHETEPFLDLVLDTLQQLEPGPRGAFLQKLLKILVNIEQSESESLAHWQGIVLRRSELSERLGKPVSVRTAAFDYFGSTALLRNPVLVEFSELKQLRYNAATDPLTGLYNRRLFDEYFSREISRSSRHAYTLALVLFDLSNFKRVNDTYGHAVGDAVLLTLARVCVETIRGSDYPFRIGGDEFAVLLPQSEFPSAQTLVRRLAQKFEQEIQTLAPDVGLRLDYGVALYPVDGENTARLFQVADQRLYAERKAVDLREPDQRTESETPPPILAEGGPPVPPEPAPMKPLSQQMRRHKRAALKGTGAYAVLCDGFGFKTSQLLDVSLGGVGFLLREAFDLPESFLIRLHLPSLVDLPDLPGSELRVRRIYTQPQADGTVRVGCQFQT